MANDQGRFVRAQIQFARQPVKLHGAGLAGRGIGDIQRIEQKPVRAVTGKNRGLPMQPGTLLCHIAWKSLPEIFALIMVAEGKMNGRQRADGFDQLSECPVITRPAGLKREVAVYDDRGGLHRPRGEFAHAGGEIVRHVDVAVFQRGIRGDVRVGEKSEGVFVPRFAKKPGMALGYEGKGGTGERSAFQKITTRELRQQNGHGASINKLSAPFNRLNLLNQMTAAEFKKKWSRYQDKEFSA